MILFLDFDGVLHPEGKGHTLNGGTDFAFCHGSRCCCASSRT